VVYVVSGECGDPCGGDPAACDAGYVLDCSGDGDCCAESWIGDGFADCEDQAFGCDLTCYDNDSGDCDDTTGGTEACADCEFDFTAYGSECCDTAWDAFGIDCASLEANYSWDCSGCNCPGDAAAVCGDGICNGDETYETCPVDGCLAPGECAEGQVIDCADDDCCPETWIGDGFEDCEDQAYGCDLTCYDDDGGDCAPTQTCEEQGLYTCPDGQCAADEASCPEPGECADGGWDCGDGQCIPASYVCDGSNEFCNASWPADCANGADEGLDFCGYEDDCIEGACDDCEYDFTNYGSECCDTAWDAFGVSCADLEANYSWDCSGCNCPGDADPVCGDGSCNGDESYETCPDDCNEPGTCDEGYVIDCSGDGDCCIESWIGDGFEDCEDQAYGCDLTCYDNDGDDCPEAPETCADTACGELLDDDISCATLEGQGYDCSVCEAEGACTTEGCGEGTVEDCSGDGDCAPETWVGDGWCDGADQPYGYDLTCYDDDGGDCAEGCDEGTVEDCSGDGDCCPDSYIGDGFADCEDQAYGCDLTCYDNDGGDCDADVEGCTDPNAYNYNEDATLDDESCLYVGDLNGDGSFDILDIVQLVNIVILGPDAYNAVGDLNDDGANDILDIVQLVNIVIAGSAERSSDASDATMIVSDNSVSVVADGYIGGIQMTLSHGNGFELNLTDKAMVADYNTTGTSTILVVVEPKDELIFTTNQSFEIVETMIANSNDMVTVNVVSDFGLSTAYPNPFNPSTTVSLTVPSADYVSVKVYNLMGQVVGVLADGMMEANVYSFTWNASDMASGVYLVKAQSSSSVDVQKVLLVK